MNNNTNNMKGNNMKKLVTAIIVMILILAACETEEDATTSTEPEASVEEEFTLNFDPPAEEEAPEELGARSNPVPLGESFSVTLDTFGDADGSVWTAVVTGPGSDLTSQITADGWNSPPDDGKVFYGVPVSMTLEEAKKEPLSTLFNVDLGFFGPSTMQSHVTMLGCGFDVPDGFETMKDVFIGGTITGVVCHEIPVEDATDELLFTLEVEGGFVFMATS
jgi:hypothetical protein